MSGFGNNQDSFAGPNQNWSYNDGNTQVSYSSQSYSWSSSSQGDSSAQNNIAAPVQQAPQMLPMAMPDFNQIHQQHMDLHRSSMQSAMQMHQNMMQNMMQPMQIQQQGQMQYSPASQAQLPPPRQPLRIQNIEEDYSDDDEYEVRALEREKQARRLQRHQEARIAERDGDARAAERDRQMLGFAQNIEDRMQRNDQRLREQSDARARQEAARHAQQGQAAEEQREAMQQLKNQMAELQSQVSKPQPAGPAFDMSALQKMISEGHTEQVSKEDIKQLIDDAVGKQLSGLAKSSDLESAAARMERNLHKVSGASDAQVAQQVQKELTSAINQVGRYVDARQKKIVGSEHSMQQPGATSHPAASQVKTEFTVEELPSDDHYQKGKRSSFMSHQKVRALPNIDSNAGNARSQLSSSQKKASVLQPSNEQPSRSSKASTVSAQAVDKNALAAPKVEQVRTNHPVPKPHPKMSTVSVQPSDATAVVRSKVAPAPVSEVRSNRSIEQASVQPQQAIASMRAPKMSAMSVQPADLNALAKPKEGRPSMLTQPDNAGMLVPTAVPQIAVTPPSRSSKISTMSVQPSDMNALAKPKSSNSGSKASTISVQPSDMNALIRPSSGDIAKRASKASKKSTMSIQPSDSNAIVRSNPSGAQQKSSSASKGSTISTIQPRNDRRGEVARQSPLRQLENVREEDNLSQALVRQSKDLAKK